MSAPSPQIVAAVDGSFRERDGAQSLIEQWDGTAWHISTPSVPGATAHSVLSGITTDSAGNFWAAPTGMPQVSYRRSLCAVPSSLTR